MMAKVKGQIVTLNKEQSSTGRELVRIQVMQISPRNGEAILCPVKFWDTKKTEGMKKDAVVEVEGVVSSYMGKDGKLKLSVDVW